VAHVLLHFFGRCRKKRLTVLLAQSSDENEIHDRLMMIRPLPPPYSFFVSSGIDQPN